MDGQPTDDQPVVDLRELAGRLQAICIGRGWTVVTAESCTGGLVVDSLTDIPGSSGYVVGGIVAYHDLVKTGQLGVPAEAIAAHGAVSVQVARAMATGARERLGSTFAVSVTGLTGPDGGSAAKPVGLTYIAVAGPDGVQVRRFGWSGDRLANKRDSARAALELLISAAEAATAAGSEGMTPGPSPAGAR
ncbi:MAG: CinA family protein [Candidatus Limnocylindrales bacterium]